MGRVRAKESAADRSERCGAETEGGQGYTKGKKRPVYPVFESRRCCVQLNKLTMPCECDFLSYQPQSTFPSLSLPPSRPNLCPPPSSLLSFFFPFLFPSHRNHDRFISLFVTTLLTPPRSLRNSRPCVFLHSRSLRSRPQPRSFTRP